MGGGGEARKGVGLWEGRHCVCGRQRKACTCRGIASRGGGEGEDAATGSAGGRWEGALTRTQVFKEVLKEVRRVVVAPAELTSKQVPPKRLRPLATSVTHHKVPIRTTSFLHALSSIRQAFEEK